MNRFKSIFVLALVAVIATAFALPVAQVSAESASLSIVPRKNYTIEPGKSIEDRLTIRNLDKAQSLELNLRVVDFTSTGEGGTPKLFLDPEAQQTTWSLKPFLTLPKRVVIEPGESKTIDMGVSIPAGHGAGDYYSAIVYSSGAADGGNVGLSASGVTLVFASIPGTVKQDLKLDKFGAYDTTLNKEGNAKGFTFITAKKPDTIGFTLTNKGNVTEAPTGSVTIKNMFGKEHVIDQVNPNASLALIGQTRTFTTCIERKDGQVEFENTKANVSSCATPNLMPGYYSATLNLMYGRNGNLSQEIVGTASFWYLPWWFVLVTIVILLAITYGVWRLVRTIRGKLYGPRFKKSTRKK